jgi:hypothetical protein
MFEAISFLSLIKTWPLIFDANLSNEVPVSSIGTIIVLKNFFELFNQFPTCCKYHSGFTYQKVAKIQEQEGFFLTFGEIMNKCGNNMYWYFEKTQLEIQPLLLITIST